MKSKNTLKKLFITLSVNAFTLQLSTAQINFSGGTYTQDFDTLDVTESTFNPWTNNTTLLGWHLYRQPATAPVAVATYRASSGTDNTGAFYSFGTAATDRALGGIGSGGTYWGSPAASNPAGWMAVAFTNTSGFTINDFTIGYTGEQWRVANTAAQSLTFSWGIGASFNAVTTWNAPGGTFDFTSPITSATASALDGNLAANRVTGLGGTVTSLGWNNGDTLWLRWEILNAPGNDHGLGIDDFSFTATVIPEPGTVALLAAGFLLAVGVTIRRRMLKVASHS